MKLPAGARINIVGAGLAGALLALLLARRGLAVALYERRADPRQARPERGRSINLALAARGMRALERAGVLESVRPLLIPMRGRMVHDRAGTVALQPYGQREQRAREPGAHDVDARPRGQGHDDPCSVSPSAHAKRHASSKRL